MARTHHCAWCREPFGLDKRADARFCSVKCNEFWHNHQKALVVKRAKVAARVPCELCGKPVPEGRRRDAAYCSVACKQLSQRSIAPRARKISAGYNRSYKYGLKPGEFEAILESQDGKCAICRTDEWPGQGKQPHFGHCHKTNKRRGVLCHDCNLGLGNFKDSIERMEAAIAYLKR